ncbi:MAG: DUF2959 domain-containing protein [Desulfobacterales bacterium]|jgi:hypothetical protein
MAYPRNASVNVSAALIAVFLSLSVGACSKVYYDTMEKVGIHKRDILVDRVESARDAQSEAQEQFTSALDQFSRVVHVKQSDLKKAYEALNAEYEDSEKAAGRVSERIDKVEAVAEALFEEWEDELKLYKSAQLRESSRKKLVETKKRYQEMLASMHRAEKSMAPVLRSFRDNVLYLKHNLNAQAIGSLRSEFSALKGEIDGLIDDMTEAIQTSNRFIAEMQQ